MCLTIRRNLTWGCVYECFHKHPKTDALVKAPQKATTTLEFFDTNNSLDPSTTK